MEKKKKPSPPADTVNIHTLHTPHALPHHTHIYTRTTQHTQCTRIHTHNNNTHTPLPRNKAFTDLILP